MISTFHGLEVAKRAMSAQQAALYTTGHNVANANTLGYTRQRVNLEATSPFPAPSMNRPQIPGQLGTGVQAGSVERVRDSFIDDQYRGENNKLGYWSAKSQALSSMETIMNEPTEEGLASTLDQFWQSLQDLSVTPQDSGTRSVVRQRGMAVADTFNYLTNSLLAVQKDYKTEIDVTQNAVNSIIKQLNEVNQQIGAVEVHGQLPNDLYDQRDLLLDDLSTYININVVPQDSGGLSSSIAEGKYDIYLADQNGNILKVKDENGLEKQVQLVDSLNSQAYGINLEYDSSKSENPVKTMEILALDQNGELDTVSPGYAFTDFETYMNSSSGSLKAHIESYGYLASDDSIKGSYSDMMRKLDAMAFTFAEEFNEVHRSGWSLTELEEGKTEGTNFFSFEGLSTSPTTSDPTGAAKALKVHQDILNSTDNIAAAGGETIDEEFAGSGSNATALANVKDTMLDYDGTNTSVTSFYQSVIGDMGVQASQAKQMTNNTNVLRDSVQTRRESVSSVSLDEEMTNMIKFQHAYNAAARTITMVDEMLDRVINNMGLVGR